MASEAYQAGLVGGAEGVSMSPEFALFLFVLGLWAAGKLYFSVFPSHYEALRERVMRSMR